MKRKIILLFLLIILSLSVIMVFSACKEDNYPQQHVHEFESGWSYNEEFHWKQAICEHEEEKLTVEKHFMGTGISCKCGYTVSDLNYTLSEDENYYIVLGKSYDETEIVVPSYYNGLPVEEIGEEAFYNTKLTKITFPHTLKKIHDNSFNYSTKLNSISVEEGNLYFYTSGNCLIEKATKKLVLGCYNSVLPTSGLEIIGSYAFYQKEIKAVIIPEGVTTIESMAFSCSEIESVYFPSTLTDIKYAAFNLCKNLSNINFPSSIKNVERFAFGGCFNIIQIENGISYVGKWIIDCDYSVTQTVIRSDTVGIATYAFSDSKINYVKIPASVTFIGEFAFCGNDNYLKSVEFENPNAWAIYFVDRNGVVATRGTNVLLNNSTLNATYLISTYTDYIWKRAV